MRVCTFHDGRLVYYAARLSMSHPNLYGAFLKSDVCYMHAYRSVFSAVVGTNVINPADSLARRITFLVSSLLACLSISV